MHCINYRWNIYGFSVRGKITKLYGTVVKVVFKPSFLFTQSKFHTTNIIIIKEENV